MATVLRAAVCPICQSEFEDVVDFRDHLAMVHGLVDDEGTETTLPESEPEPEPVTAPPPLSASAAELEPLPVRPPSPPSPPIPERRAKHPTSLVWLGLVVVVQLLVGLAGVAVVGDDEDRDRTVSAASRPADDGAAESDGTPVPATVDPLLDHQRAEDMVLRQSDLPGGWTIFDTDEFSDDSEGLTTGVDDVTASGVCDEMATLGDPPAQATSGFMREPSLVIGEADVFRSVDAAADAMGIIGRSLPCLAELFAAGAQSEPGVTVKTGGFTPLNFPTYGDESMAVAAQGTMSFERTRLPFRMDLLTVRKDRAMSFVMVVHFGGDGLTDGEEKFMLEQVTGRMARGAV